jgi:plastocyanin
MTRESGCVKYGLVLVVFAAVLGSSVTGLAVQELTLTIREHRFDPAEVRAPAETPLRLVITNADRTPEEFESYDLNREKLIRPGQTVTIHLPALKPGEYEFFGEFHPETAQGRLIVE